MSAPLLSVVVPCYNVTGYLEECFDSILGSDYGEIEVILVDDGSTDGTGVLCDSLAHGSPRSRVIHQENMGLGAARNTGVAASRGDYLAFVDSDDIVPRGAYKAMMGSLLRTGSGAAVGGVERFDSKRRWQPWFVEEVHSIPRLGIRGLDFPPVVWNVFAWSKVFEKSTYRRVVGEFPRGLYEDQVASAKLYTSDVRIDVLPDIVYGWRSREDGSSITQNKTSVNDLRERLGVAFETARVIDAAADRGFSEYWYRKLLGEDLWWYFRVVPNCSNFYWGELVNAVRRLAHIAPPSAVWGIPRFRRDLVVLAARGDRAKFIQRLKAGAGS